MTLKKCKAIGCTNNTHLNSPDFCLECLEEIGALTETSTVMELEPAVQLSLDMGQNMERDPSGKDQHQSGAKLDGGKIRPGLVLGGFARALWAVSEIGTFGAAKYTDNGWMEVPNGQARYDDAGMRHWLKDKMGQQIDPDSEKTHLAHEAWNALAKLDLHLRANP